MKKNNEEKTISYKKSIFVILITVFFLLSCVALVNAVVDPYFHYHKPFTNYRLIEERYVNDGISRQFDYNAVIIGNSLSQNFKTTQYDELFGVKSVKLPYSGAGVKELWTALGRIVGRNELSDNIKDYMMTDPKFELKDYGKTKAYRNDIKEVIVVLDMEDVMRSYSWHRYNDYPEYLYDDNPFNDVGYLLNKETLYRGSFYNIGMTLKGSANTTFDEYSAWERQSGPREACEGLSKIKKETTDTKSLSDRDRDRVFRNIACNIIPVIRAAEDTEFRLIIPPVSIAKWAAYHQAGETGYMIEGMRFAVSQLAAEENADIYSFMDEYDLITDLTHYCDDIHYDASVNEWMLEEIKNDHHEVTSDSYETYFDELAEFYGNYDYTILNEYIE